jgi:hypothetical protein
VEIRTIAPGIFVMASPDPRIAGSVVVAGFDGNPDEISIEVS